MGTLFKTLGKPLRQLCLGVGFGLWLCASAWADNGIRLMAVGSYKNLIRVGFSEVDSERLYKAWSSAADANRSKSFISKDQALRLTCHRLPDSGAYWRHFCVLDVQSKKGSRQNSFCQFNRDKTQLNVTLNNMNDQKEFTTLISNLKNQEFYTSDRRLFFGLDNSSNPGVPHLRLQLTEASD